MVEFELEVEILFVQRRNLLLNISYAHSKAPATRLTSSICLTPIPLPAVTPLELGLLSSLAIFAFTGELCTPPSPVLKSTLLRRLCRALSTFLSRSLSCSKLAPDPARAPVVDRAKCAEELLVLEVGVILVSLEELDSGRVRLDP